MVVPSPCINVCEIERTSGLCRGCRRTIDEIAAWGASDDRWKLAVLKRLEGRALSRG